jgi:hypothetical protein
MLTQIKPQIIDGVEFYVSLDGKSSGMSQRGLCRFGSIPRTSLYTIITNPTAPFWASKWAKGIASSDLDWLQDSGNAQVISSKACSALVGYFGFEKGNLLAEEAYHRFAAAGMHAFILVATGFKAVNPVDSLTGFEAVKQLARLYLNIDENVKNKPGLASILEEYSNTNYSGLPAEKILLKDYLLSKKVVLDRSEMIRVSGVVAATYKAHRHELPEFSNVSYRTVSGKRAHRRNYVYGMEDYPIIDSALVALNIKSVD